jgi:N-acetylmuramoyl-L-alanine amidase
VVFKVQIAARSQPLNIKQAPYNSFKNVSFEEQNGIYKYMVGNFSKHSEAQAQLAELKAKGFPDAFIVVYQQGKRLSAAEAKKHLP